MKIIVQIDNTSKILEKTSQNKLATVEDLRLIQSQVENRKRIMENIQEAIRISAAQIKKEQNKQKRLNQEYRLLVKDYNSLIRMSYIKLLTENQMVYLLSAADWDQSLQRLGYSRSLENYLQRQINSLHLTNSQLQASIESIREQQNEQQILLKQEKENFTQLENDEKRMDKILYQLQGDEKRLKGALYQQKKDREELNHAIELVILASLKENREDPDERSESNPGNNLGFESNRNRLPWPINNGSLISKYGKQKHPTLENVYIQNNGIDILKGEDVEVKSVFAGEVAGTMQIPGSDLMIIIRHGNYYSVYSRMKEVWVKKGDLVSQGQKIGKLGDADAILHFEIWYDKQKLDPENWLR